MNVGVPEEFESLPVHKKEIIMVQTKKHLKQIIGFPNYAFDVECGEVYTLAHGRVQKIRIRTNPHSGHKIVQLINGKKKATMQLNRLWYAVLNGLEYKSIPRTFLISMGEDNHLVVETRADVTRKAVGTRRRNARLTRLEHLDRKMAELEIMKRFYTSFDSTEVMQYIESMHENFVKWIKKQYVLSDEFAQDLWDESFLEMEKRIKEPESVICDITLTLKWVIKQVKASISERYRREAAEWRKDVMFGWE